MSTGVAVAATVGRGVGLGVQVDVMARVAVGSLVALGDKLSPGDLVVLAAGAGVAAVLAAAGAPVTCAVTVPMGSTVSAGDQSIQLTRATKARKSATAAAASTR